jgi:hypothetical protein
MEVAPRFVKEVRSTWLDTRFLNAALNLSDVGSAVTSRTNLGFTNQTAGAVLLGTGSNDFTSDPTRLFWDTATKRLGINTNTPSVDLDVVGSGQISVQLVTPQIYGSTSASGSLLINSTSNATKGNITLGSVIRVDEANLRAYISNNTANFGLSTAITSIVGSVAETNLNLMNTASSTAGALLEFEKRRGGAGGTTDVSNGDTVGTINFNVRRNAGANTDSVATIYSTYQGDSTTRSGDLHIGVSNAGAPTDRIILRSTQEIEIGVGQKQFANSRTAFYSSIPSSITGAVQIKSVGGSTSDCLVLEGPSGAFNAGQKWNIYGDDGQLTIIPSGGSQGLVMNSQGRVKTGPSGQFNFNLNEGAASANTTVAGPLATDPIIAIQNSDSTANNFEMLVFVSSGAFVNGAIACVNEGHLVGSSGHLTFLVRNAGTLEEAVQIRSNNEVRFMGTTSGYVGLSTVAAPTSYSLILPSAQATIANQALVNDSAGNLSWSTMPILTSKAGNKAISNASRTVAVTFATSFGSTNYTINAVIKNTTDNNPLYLVPIVINKQSTGFTLEWNDLTDSSNYVLEWSVEGFYDP